MEIRINLNPLESTTVLPYLVWVVVYNNNDWVELYRNLHKSQRRWKMVENLLRKTWSLIKSQEMMYKAVVQSVLLYGSEIWVVTDTMMTVCRASISVLQDVLQG